MRPNIGECAKWEDISVGRWVYLDRKTVQYLNTVFEQYDSEHQVFEGCHQIVEVDTSFENGPLVPEVAQVKATIYLHHKDWNREKVSPVPVVINPFCSIILAGALLLSESIRTVVVDLQDLVAMNRDRFDCVGCGEPLNVVTTNLRICNNCEENLKE